MRTHAIDQGTAWFRSKRYGWGWSWPLAWQGWLLLGVYCALLAMAALLLDRHEIGAAVFGSAAALLTLVLLAVCWLTSGPPRWRWGGKD